MSNINECVAYLKENGGFTRLMEGMFDLYVRYERCFGAVRLVRPSPEEEKAVSDFFKRDYYNQALIRISLADFERNAQKMFSPEITLESLLEAYFQKRIISQAMNEKVSSNAFSVFIDTEMIPRYNGTDAGAWLREVDVHLRRVYRAWADNYTDNPQGVAGVFTAVCNALNDLPFRNGDTSRSDGEIMRLSVFSLKHTGDAHAMGMSGAYGPLFLRALAWLFETSLPSSPEDYNALYFQAGLLFDGVLSQVAVRGLTAIFKDTPDEACAAYDTRNEAFVLNLENLSRFSRVEAHKNTAFIVENLHVFAALHEYTQDCPCTLICAASGFNTALTLLLDKLSASGTTLYYSGDMDYAGLCLADKIFLRYPKQFVPWRYGKQDFERVISDNELYMTDRQKDVGLYNEDLASLLSMMRKRGKTAPQTALIADLAADIQTIMQ